MDARVQLSLTCYWWTWDDPVIRKAMDAAHLDHWVSVVEEKFHANSVAGERPCGWDELHLMQRERQNIQRVASGKSTSTKQFLLGVASILNLDVQTLFPPTALWIAKTVLSLCALKRRQHYEGKNHSPREAHEQALRDGVGITLDDSLAYATFMLEHPPNDSDIGERAIERRLCGTSGDTQIVVKRVASVLGPSLELVDPQLPSERIRHAQLQ